MSKGKDTLSSTKDVFPQRMIIGPLTQATPDAFVTLTVPTGIAQLQNIGENDTTVEVFELISVECVGMFYSLISGPIPPQPTGEWVLLSNAAGYNMGVTAQVRGSAH